MAGDKEKTVSIFCHLAFVICYLTPETRHLTPMKDDLAMSKSIRVL